MGIVYVLDQNNNNVEVFVRSNGHFNHGSIHLVRFKPGSSKRQYGAIEWKDFPEGGQVPLALSIPRHSIQPLIDELYSLMAWPWQSPDLRKAHPSEQRSCP